jgi:hypothetical protein
VNARNTETVLAHYIQCALWASVDGDGEPLDGTYTADDLAPETLASMREDCTGFIGDISGIDFWLTRNRHGTGFWDRGHGSIGEQLTALAHVYGESDLYVGDDGLIYLS